MSTSQCDTTPFDARIADEFEFEGRFLAAEPLGSGHINDTYLVHVVGGEASSAFVMQRVNRTVFPDVPGVMHNIERTLRHLRGKLERAGTDDLDRRVLELVPTRRGESYFIDERGDYWRAFVYISGATSHDQVSSERLAFEAARAFGRFQDLLHDLPGPPLVETLPRFHDTPKRLADLTEAARGATADRLQRARREIAFAEQYAQEAGVLTRLAEHGALPLRVVHNDTKVNNVMICDRTGEGLCVIDLDTVMLGLGAYDFGDLVRTATCEAAEDERDLTRIEVRMPLFRAIAEGFVRGAGRTLSPAERSTLHIGGWVITFECGVRFLTDYLQGDRYFRIGRPEQNLDRARAQFRLATSIRERLDDMGGFIEALPAL